MKLQNILWILTIIENTLISKSYYFRSNLPTLPNNLQTCKLKPPQKIYIYIHILSLGSIDAIVFGKRFPSSHPTLQMRLWLRTLRWGYHPGGPYMPSQVSLQERGKGRFDSDRRQAIHHRERESFNSDKATNQGLSAATAATETRRGKSRLSPRDPDEACPRPCRRFRFRLSGTDFRLSLQNWERINLCCFNHYICGDLSQQPQETNTRR